MKHCSILRGAILAFLAGMAPRILPAQQDGLVAHPSVYRLQFENSWVRIVRVSVPGNADLSGHTHPPGMMMHVYLTNADPIDFYHDGDERAVTRPYVYARSYRLGRARPEIHAVVNRFPGASEYLRVEFKTVGNEIYAARMPAPPLGSATKSVLEATTATFRVSRVTIAARDSFVVSADSGRPALLIAVTEGVPAFKLGGERFVEEGRREPLRNPGDKPAELLRVDFLTPPTGRR